MYLYGEKYVLVVLTLGLSNLIFGYLTLLGEVGLMCDLTEEKLIGIDSRFVSIVYRFVLFELLFSSFVWVFKIEWPEFNGWLVEEFKFKHVGK